MQEKQECNARSNLYILENFHRKSFNTKLIFESICVTSRFLERSHDYIG